MAGAGVAAGAVIVNWAKTSISEQFPSTWLYLQGLLFVVVIVFLPKGVAGAVEHLRVFAARIPLPRGMRLPAGPKVPAPTPAPTKEIA